MSIKRVQDCEMCGRERTLLALDRESLGGWTELKSGNKEITLCDICKQAIVEHAQERAAYRANHSSGVEHELYSGRTLSFDIIEEKVRKELQNAIR